MPGADPRTDRRLGSPARTEGVVGDQRLPITAGGHRPQDADDQHLALADALPSAGDVLAPHVRQHRGCPQRDRQGEVTVQTRSPRGDGRLLSVLHRPDVRQRQRRREGRADRGVGEHVVADARVRLDPLGVEQGAGGDAERRVERVVEQPTTRSRRQAAHPRQLRRMLVVPRVRAIDPIGGGRDRTHSLFAAAGPAGPQYSTSTVGMTPNYIPNKADVKVMPPQANR